MTRPRLLIVSFSTIVADARVLKQVRRFRDDLDVHTLGYGPAPDGVVSHIRVPDTLPIWRYDRAAVMLRRYRWAYWNNAAIAFASAALKDSRWDVVLANDVDAVGLALAQHSEQGVHVDLHEYAPRQKEDVLKWRLFVAPFVRWMCREFVLRADSVTTLGQGIADEYQRVYGIRAEVVTNAAPYHALEATTVSNPIRLVHSGACLRDRNLMLMAKAAMATDVDVTLDFFLTPNDPTHLVELKSFAATTDGRVRVHDPVPYDQLIRTLNRYDVGVFLLPPVNFNYRWALPNKFFDFVQARLGVVIGPSPEMARVLDARGFGAVAEEFSADALTRVLNTLSAGLVATWKQAADAAAPELSGESETEVWARAIDRLLSVQARGEQP
ncbi:glycosyltransferase family 1 protein [Microbacterium bovistercoris]|uniref:Glycosyltransferase family 1 protein n=1 Tax=Microbacterium bovistercoris TaxID=2293570 RepID=A0A371NWN4_9MICO|nr:glycosyltransferase family 1 protein [Microbacterium bovistercoris]REJ07581.1 glycosyltransferase family 1 protein [Microbacterium bovistercoris]